MLHDVLGNYRTLAEMPDIRYELDIHGSVHHDTIFAK